MATPSNTTTEIELDRWLGLGWKRPPPEQQDVLNGQRYRQLREENARRMQRARQFGTGSYVFS